MFKTRKTRNGLFGKILTFLGVDFPEFETILGCQENWIKIFTRLILDSLSRNQKPESRLLFLIFQLNARNIF